MRCGSWSSSTASSLCDLCVAGSAAPAGVGARWRFLINVQTACAPCAKGRYAPQNGTQDCAFCDPRFYSDALGSRHCEPCAPGTKSASQVTESWFGPTHDTGC